MRSLDQRMDALRRANEIRVRRAQLKKDLKSGSAQIEQILRSPPAYVETAKVFDMLMAVPKFGRVKAARFLNQCRISQSKTVGGLSERQSTEWWTMGEGFRSAPILSRHAGQVTNLGSTAISCLGPSAEAPQKNDRLGLAAAK
jgi:hypothetical protein